MSYTIGFCDKCGVLMHEWGIKLDEESQIGDDRKIFGYVNPCPVCKERTAFIAVESLSDW